MRKRRFWGYSGLALITALSIGASFGASRALAETSQSPSYQMTESQFGAASSEETCSTSYCSTASIGDVGNSSSQNSPEFGEAKYSEPILEMIVTSGSSDLGTLTTERTATKTTEIKIRNYLSGGYFLQIVGDAPKFGDHTLLTPSTPTPSEKGTEQFGMNIVANTDPTVGANPVQVPSGSSVFGEAGDNYGTANQFMYSSGDLFAKSLLDSGGTDYTLSMIINIASSTPSGHYSGDFSAVLIPMF